jgi:hypothetical protein
MNIKNLLLSGLLLTSVSATLLPSPSAFESLKKYTKSLAFGSIVGTATGAISGATISLMANTLPIQNDYVAALFAFTTLYTIFTQEILQDSIIKEIDPINSTQSESTATKKDIQNDTLTRQITRFISWAVLWKSMSIDNILQKRTQK